MNSTLFKSFSFDQIAEVVAQFRQRIGFDHLTIILLPKLSVVGIRMMHSYFRALSSNLFLMVPWVVVLYVIIVPISASAQPVILQEILSIDGFHSISDLTVGNDSSIYVADHRNSSLSKFDSSGRLIRKVGGQGVAPGEFVSGPRHLTLMDSMLIVSDHKGTGTLHFFDLNLNFKVSIQVSAPLDMDVAPDERLYLGTTDLATLDTYVTIYTPNEVPQRLFELSDIHRYNLENRFILLARYPERIAIVFQAVNRIDVYDPSGHLLNRFSIESLPLRYQGHRIDTIKRQQLPDDIVESISYVPGGLIYTSAVMDHEGNLFLEHGGKIEEMPASRSVYMITLEGKEEGMFQMPRGTSLKHIDETGHAYAAKTTKESTVLKKYKIEYQQ